MKDEAPHRAGGIDTVSEALKVDTALAEFVNQQHQISHASPEPFKLPDHQRVALTQRSQKLF